MIPILLGILFISSSTALWCRVSQSNGIPATRQLQIDRGSSVKLQWTYLNNGLPCLIKQKIFGQMASSGLIDLAVKEGAGGLQIATTLPAHFDNRLSTNPADSALVIQDAQYNDSLYQFSSSLTLPSLAPPTPVTLLPAFLLSVRGAPVFTSPPPNETKANEGESLRIIALAEANPKPLVSFILSNQTMPIAAQPLNIYPFVYKSTFEIANLTSDFCGKYLNTEFFNSIGSAGKIQTFINMKLRLDGDLGLNAMFLNKSCIRVAWNMKTPGYCRVKYSLVLKNGLGSSIFSTFDYNIKEYFIFGSATLSQVNFVSLTVSHEGRNAFAMTSVRTLQTTTTTTTSATLRSSSVKPGGGSSTSVTLKSTTPITNTSSEHGRVTKKLTKIISSTSRAQSNRCKSSKSSANHRASQNSSLATVAALSSIVFILVVVVILLVVWNQRLRASAAAEKAKSKNQSKKTELDEVHYMDLKERYETTPNYEPLDSHRQRFNMSNADVNSSHYVNATVGFSENPTNQHC